MMESTIHSLSTTSQPQSTRFPYSSSSTQLQDGYIGQQMGYSYCTQQQHQLFGQYNNLYPSSGILPLPASTFPDKREVILREIEKERVRAQMMLTDIAKMRILQGKIDEEATWLGASESPPDDIFLEKTEEEWSCAICRTNFISDSALSDHLCVKKHKVREGSSKPQSLCYIVSSDTMLDKLLENPKPGKCERESKRTQSVKKNPDLKKTMWCGMCQVGARSEIIMKKHEKGKKHLERLKRRAENGETVLGYQNEKMEVPVDCVQHISEGGKNMNVENVTVCEKGDYDSVNESKVEENEMALEVTEQDEINAQHVDIVEPGSDSTVDAVLPDDEIIAKGELRQTERRSFLLDTYVLRETELLEHSKFDQFKTAEVRVSGVKCGIQNEHEEEEIVLMVNPDAKSKVVTPPVADNNIYLSGNCILYGKAETKQNGEIGLCTEKEKIEEPVNCDKPVCEGAKSIPRSENVDLVLAEPRLDFSKPLDNIRIVQMNDHPKRTAGSFWRQKCQVGTMSEKDINNLKEETKQNGEIGLCTEKEKIEEPVNCDKHISEGGKSIPSSENVDLLLAEARLEFSKPLDKSENGVVSLLMQRGTVDLRVSEVRPVAEKGIKEDIVLVANTDADLSGCPCDIVLYKKAEGERSSVATFESFISEQLCQKEHKCEEVVLKPRSPRGNSKSNIGKRSLDTLLLKKSEPLVIPKADNFKNSPSVNKKGDSKKKGDSFWREKGRVGIFSEVEIDEKKGSKDVNYLKEIVQNTETRLGNQKNEVSSEKSVNSENVDVPSEARLKFLKPLDAFETLPIQLEAVDLRVSKVSRNEHVVSGSKWKAVTPPVSDTSKSAVRDMCEKKYNLKGDSLRPPSPGNHSVKGKVSSGTLLSENTEVLKLKSDNIKKHKAKTIQGVQKNCDPKMTKEMFWREKNQVGTSSHKVKDAEKGRKHNEIVQNGEAGPCDLKEDIEPVNLVKHIPEVEQNGESGANTDVDLSGCPSDIVLYKKAEGERSSVATCESSVSEQLCQKEQKCEEAALKPQRNSKSTTGKFSLDTLLLKKSEPLVNPKADNFKNIPSVNKKGESKKKEDSFWREKCWLGVSSEVEIDEKKGRKDVNHLKEIVQNSETRPCDQKTEVSSEKSVNSENIDVPSSEARLELLKPLDASDNAFETLPNQIKAVDLRVSKVSRNAHVVSGSKWKAATPPVSDTSKSAVRDMCEKKYKLKGDSLKPPSPGKHSVIGKVSCGTLLSKNTEVVNLKSDNIKKDYAKTIQGVQKNGDPKMTKEMFWREKNQVGTSSDKVKDAEKGRKRNEIVQSGEAGPCDLKEDIEPVNLVKHIPEVGQIILPHISTKEDAKAAGVDIFRSGVSSTLRAVSPKDGMLNAISEWKCDLCQVIATNKSSLNEHLCGKKHKLKEASLKAQRPRNNSSVRNGAADSLLENPKSDNIKKDYSPIAVSNVGQKGDFKKTTQSYWRQSSQVEPSEKVTHNVEKGKESVQNGESGTCNQKKTKVPVNRVEHVSDIEKSIFSDFFGVV